MPAATPTANRRGTLVVCADWEDTCREAARRFAAAAQACLDRQRQCAVALAGGSTPRRFYELLASNEFRHRISWPKMHFFWGDERRGARDHPESNYRMAREALLAHLPVPAENIHPMPVELVAEEAARRYEADLRFVLGSGRGVSRLDLLWLGLGADGHIASLFPASPALNETERLVAAVAPRAGPARLTLTLPMLNHTRLVFFLVRGAEKAMALRAALEEAGPLPVQRLQPAGGELTWFVDPAAASQLSRVRVHA